MKKSAIFVNVSRGQTVDELGTSTNNSFTKW